MKIELWSDYACPYCYIGEKRLEKAMEAIANKEGIEVEFKAFELDPQASKEVTSTTKVRIAKKYRISEDEAQDMIDNITRTAAGEGLKYNYGTTRYTNTFDAHRVTKYAQSKGKTEIIEKLFDAYFTDNLELSNHQLLIDIASSIGLDKEEVKRVLDNNEFAEEVRNDEREAYVLGVQGVPFFLINRKYQLSGAQPVEMIRNALVRIMEEEKKENIVNIEKSAAMACSINGCNLEGNDND